jgi:cytoskeletal protein RodZ
MNDDATPREPMPPAEPAADPDLAEATGTPEERLAAFGRWLARERELRGLSRDEVGKAIKLAPGVVEALESGEEARIPPRTYVVGYLRGYAGAVGLDPDEVVLRFEEAVGPARDAVRARPRTPNMQVIVAVALALAVAVAGALALLRG